MPYGTLKADTLTYYTATGDVNLAISGIAISGSPLISGVSGVFTTSVSGATVTGNAGQFTTITGGTAQFTNITGVSGTFTSRISGATVTGTSGQFTTITATTGVFTTSISGATISGDVGLFTTISGSQGVFNSGLSVPSGTASSPSISFNGDPNTGIYSTGADQLALSTGGSGRLFVDASGQVGIGTSPSTSFHVAGTTRVGANDTTDAALEIGAGATGNRSAYIDLVGDTTYSDYALRIIRSNSGANANSSINHKGTGNFTLRTEEAGALVFSTSNTERLRITSAGLVGVGTSSPTRDLVVNNSSSHAYVSIRSSDATTASILLGDQTNDAEGQIVYRNDSNSLTFVNGGERMRIDSSGRVGIGTTSPASNLHVSGTTDYLFLVDSTTRNRTLAVYADSTNVRLIAQNNARTSFAPLLLDGSEIRFLRGGGECARVDDSGRLLVGTSSALNVGAYSSGFEGFQVAGTTSAARASLSRWDASTADPGITFAKSRGGTVGTNGIVSSGDNIGRVEFTADDGTSFLTAARILAQVDGTPGANDMPGRLVFSTTADGASSPTERVRISQNGVVTVKNGAVAEIGTLTDGATVTPDFAANCNFTLTISGNRTLANPTNITAGQTGSIFIIQGTGSNALSWGSYWDFAGGTAPTLSTASGAVDRVDYVVRTSTSIHTVFTANYS